MMMSVKENKGIMIIELSGEANIQRSLEIKNEIKAVIDQGKNKLVVDLEKVKHIDSTMLDVLISGLKDTRRENGDLKLAALQKEVWKVFELTQLNKVFDIFDNQEDAVKAFQ